jgi:hypothetical protein
MRIKQHEDLILTVRCQQAQETEAVRQVVSDLASDLHTALDRRGLPSTVVVCSGDGTQHDKVLETIRT